jgi:hypothetical protein
MTEMAGNPGLIKSLFLATSAFLQGEFDPSKTNVDWLERRVN